MSEKCEEWSAKRKEVRDIAMSKYQPIAGPFADIFGVDSNYLLLWLSFHIPTCTCGSQDVAWCDDGFEYCRECGREF